MLIFFLLFSENFKWCQCNESVSAPCAISGEQANMDADKVGIIIITYFFRTSDFYQNIKFKEFMV